MKKIGITTAVEYIGQRALNALGTNYSDSIIKTGALPILIPLCDDDGLLDQYMDLIDGLVISGGDDINPNLYQESNEGLSRDISDRRDRQELVLFKKALERGYPVLGICRGLQLINVYFGGTLYQDIPSQFSADMAHQNLNSPLDTTHHEIQVVEGSILHKIYMMTTLSVNSRHHQSIKTLGNGLVVTSQAADGVIESIESPEYKLIAVQWHPENLTQKEPSHLVLFKAFVESALCDKSMPKNYFPK